LKSGGLLVFETGYDQASEVSDLMAGDGRYDDIRIFRDLAGIDRAVAVCADEKYFLKQRCGVLLQCCYVILVQEAPMLYHPAAHRLI
jgi:hypothetical protein